MLQARGASSPQFSSGEVSVMRSEATVWPKERTKLKTMIALPRKERCGYTYDLIIACSAMYLQSFPKSGSLSGKKMSGESLRLGGVSCVKWALSYFPQSGDGYRRGN